MKQFCVQTACPHSGVLMVGAKGLGFDQGMLCGLRFFSLSILAFRMPWAHFSRQAQ